MRKELEKAMRKEDREAIKKVEKVEQYWKRTATTKLMKEVGNLEYLFQEGVFFSKKEAKDMRIAGKTLLTIVNDHFFNVKQ